MNVHNSAVFSVRSGENSHTPALPARVRKAPGRREELCVDPPSPLHSSRLCPANACAFVLTDLCSHRSKLNRWCPENAWKSTVHQNPYSNRHVTKSFNNNGIFSTTIVVAGSCNINNMYKYFISSVFKYAESAEAPEDWTVRARRKALKYYEVWSSTSSPLMETGEEPI